MKLITYLKNNGITHENFAKLIPVATARTVQRYATGERMPRPETIARISELTNGQVTAADFYDVAPVAQQDAVEAAPA